MGGGVTPLKSNKGSDDGQFFRRFRTRSRPRIEDASISRSRVRNDDDHPGRGFFHHISEPSGGAAGRHLGKDRSATDDDRSKPIAVARTSGGQDMGKTTAYRREQRQIQRFTGSKRGQLSVDFVKNDGKVLRRERLILRSVLVAFKKLCQDLPKHLTVNGAQHAQMTGTRQEVEERERAAYVEFPGRKQQRAVTMLDFKG